ncbi:DUF6174 domain-containing protein [uncultured Thiothrix sp.]|jgi:hypothetical protein|uniref:DUF6174 domain-containing protein n=1 Tax=uncultured Thiothrix sp. TaxID=223185 RepID=UPI002625DA27|nr:DUF6174 domain-containing protein [uncultured Thiothrix sp.]HMT91598.1 DUF6174 domain-containing protein [Thiolinea sp.]
MVVVSQQPVLQPLSALANQNTAAVQSNNANLTNPSATTIVNTSAIKNGFFDRLISKFEASNNTTAQANTPVASNVNYLTQQLTSQINQNTSTNGSSNGQNVNNNSNLTTNVSLNNLNTNLAKWESYLAGNDYSFTLQQTSGGQRSGPINVNVTNGQVSSASYPDGTPVSAAVFSTIPTIEQMFANIRQATSANERADALYNPSRGFPEFVLLSHNEQTSTDDVSYILNNVSINA